MAVLSRRAPVSSTASVRSALAETLAVRAKRKFNPECHHSQEYPSIPSALALPPLIVNTALPCSNPQELG